MPTKNARRNRKTPRTPSAAGVSVQRATRAAGAPSSRRLRAWARLAAAGASRVTLRLVGLAESRRLNRTYRRRNRATNVLAFAYARRPLHGDIVLCHPVIRREARAQGKRLAAHYAHMVVHGMLHLRGLRHDRRAATERMERLERRLLARLGFADPYAVE